MSKRTPPPVPRRRAASPRVQTDLARVRRIAGQLDERDRPFDPSRAPTWRGSSRDLVVNGKGIYHGSGLGKDTFVIYQGRDNHWRVDLVTSNGGNHQDVTGPNRGYVSAEEAFEQARREHHRRAIRGALEVYVYDGDSFSGYVANGRRSIKMSDGYAYQLSDTGDFSSWRDSIDEDWDQEMVTRSQAQGARMVGEKTIDGARCYVFESGDKTTYWAQVKHMVRNGDIDPRDIPKHLHPAEMREEPEENGQDIGYSQGGYRSTKPGWYQVEYATGSDYSGGSVHESNYRVLTQMLAEAHPADEQPVVWAATSGGHGTYGIVVRYGDLEEEIREAIDGLEDYALLDEEDHSQLEIEQQDEAWEDWAKDDFIKECAKDLGVDAYELKERAEAAGIRWMRIFEIAREKANVYWEDQQGAGQFIRVEEVADAATDFISGTKFPSYVDANMVEEYEKLGVIVAALQEESEE